MWRQDGRPYSQNLFQNPFLLCVVFFVSLSSSLYCPSHSHTWFSQSVLNLFCSQDVVWYICSLLMSHHLNLITLNETNLALEIISSHPPPTPATFAGASPMHIRVISPHRGLNQSIQAPMGSAFLPSLALIELEQTIIKIQWWCVCKGLDPEIQFKKSLCAHI